MWTPSTQQIVTAAQKAAEAAAAARAAAYPPLPAPKFWGAMRATGHEAEVRAWIDTIEDPVSKAFVSAQLDFEAEYNRDDPIMEEARVAIGITGEQLDTLWTWALSQ